MDKTIKVSVEIPMVEGRQSIQTVLLFHDDVVSLNKVFEELSIRYGDWIITFLTEDKQGHLNKSLVFIMDGYVLDCRKKAEDYRIIGNASICILNVMDGG
ncbi:MAG: hypothetical protein HPY66_2115 [Firmicutes bacterium]|nr:hypothetical protein [Bacillota bacterium]MDI6705874.1 hypothetical protein [Bacillota bacterium]